mgnify:FL=1
MCSAGILTIQNVGELCAQRLQQLCIDKKEAGGKTVSARKNSTPYTKKARIVHPHLSRVMCYSYCSCIAAREFRSEWKPSSPSMAAASNGMLSDAVTGGRSLGVFPSTVGAASGCILDSISRTNCSTVCRSILGAAAASGDSGQFM